MVHRLGRFASIHPDIDLRIAASLEHVDFAREDIDLAIRHGDGQWQGLDATRLCKEQLFPVCSPKLMRGRRALRKPGDLKDHTLLHIDNRRDWIKWLNAANVVDADLSRCAVFNQTSMAIDAAVRWSIWPSADKGACTAP